MMNYNLDNNEDVLTRILVTFKQSRKVKSL